MSDLERKSGERAGVKYWAVVGPLGGVHAWHMVSDIHCSGVEYHDKKPSEWHSRSNIPPHNCWLIGCECWHDGTSLYAEEMYTPMFEAQNDEPIYRQLERDYMRHFTEPSP